MEYDKRDLLINAASELLSGNISSAKSFIAKYEKTILLKETDIIDSNSGRWLGVTVSSDLENKDPLF